MGRPGKFRALIQKYFVVQPNNNSEKKCSVWKCKFCSRQFAKNYYRMVRHLQICPKQDLPEAERAHINALCKDKEQKINKVIQKPKWVTVKHENSQQGSSLCCSSSKAQSELVSPLNSTDEDDSDVKNTVENNVKIEAHCHSQSMFSNKNEDFLTTKKIMSTFVDSMAKEEETAIWDVLSRAVFATGTPLNFTESPYWVDAFKMIRPSLQLPSKYHLSSTLLDKEYNRLKLLVGQKVAHSEYLSVQLDGWSNVRCESIVNIILTTPEPVIFKTVDTGSEKHTGEYIAKLIQEVFEEVGNKKIISLVTDNAKNMFKAQQLVKESYPQHPVSIYGCVAHLLNLFVKDVMAIPEIEQVAVTGKDIIKKIKYSHGNHSKFVQFQKVHQEKKTSLKLPGLTRWCSNVYSFKSLLDNKKALQMFAISNEAELDHTLINTILDNSGFWESVQVLYDLLSQVLKWTLILEADECRIPYVIPAFYDISCAISKLKNSTDFCSFEKRILDLLKQRESYAVKDIHKAAHLLNPRDKGRLLSHEDSIVAMQYIYNLGNFILPDNVKKDIGSELAMYRSNTGMFQIDFVWDSLAETSDKTTMCPTVWWKGICGSTSLSKIACAILQCPPTTAATERSFSTASIQHSKRRNRLENLRAAKLTYIKYNLKKLVDSNKASKFHEPGNYILPEGSVSSIERDMEMTDYPDTMDDNEEFCESEVITLEICSDSDSEN